LFRCKENGEFNFVYKVIPDDFTNDLYTLNESQRLLIDWPNSGMDRGRRHNKYFRPGGNPLAYMSAMENVREIELADAA
jgi:hypothetical protein